MGKYEGHAPGLRNNMTVYMQPLTKVIAVEDSVDGEWVRHENYAALLEENRRLREALDSIVDYGGIVTGEDGREMQQIARSALSSTEPEVPCHHGPRCDGRGVNCGPAGAVVVEPSEEESK